MKQAPEQSALGPRHQEARRSLDHKLGKLRMNEKLDKKAILLEQANVRGSIPINPVGTSKTPEEVVRDMNKLWQGVP